MPKFFASVSIEEWIERRVEIGQPESESVDILWYQVRIDSNDVKDDMKRYPTD